MAATIFFSLGLAPAHSDTSRKEAHPPIPQRYIPPAGFNGHAWQTPLGEFKGLQLLKAQSVLGYVGKGTSEPRIMGGHLFSRIEGEGAHFMGEYFFPSEPQPYRDAGAGAAVLEIYYLFCAAALDADVPKDLNERLSLCGSRVMFESETLEELGRIHDADYRSNYDRILQTLIRRHGEPKGYRPQPRVLVETEDGSFGEPRRRRFEHWRWCGVRAQELYPNCLASISLSFDPNSGAGVVIYGTRPLFEFAEARHASGDPNNLYYVHLRKKGPNKRYSQLSDRRTLIRLGTEPTRGPMPEEMLRQFRLPDQ